MALNPSSLSSPVSPSPADEGNKRTGLARLIDTAVSLSLKQETTLKMSLQQGTKFYDNYNDSRLQLAFASFDKDMRLAIYELLFLMQVNHPKFMDWRFMSKSYHTKNGARIQVPKEEKINLYFPDAPFGVQGIGMLSNVFRKEYEAYVSSVFDHHPYGGEGNIKNPPIVTIQSVGSIGTIGHKSKDSDLDLQVIFDLTPFQFDTREWTDEIFKTAINHEHKWMINQIRAQKKIPTESLQDPATRKELSKQAASRIQRAYPGLYRYLVLEDKEFAIKVLGRTADKTLRIQVLHEILNLMKRYEKVRYGAAIRKKEQLLKERLMHINNYINLKFPEAEIYLFVYGVEGFRQGTYSSTLEFKESSGSAYEMILNYDTLMPGIQFTPMMPTHFLLPPAINNDVLLFPRLMDYSRFGVINLFNSEAHRLVDLGNTPNLTTKYVAEHGGAIYWEAFKASSGNLPKAFLNLLRFEMMLDEKYIKTTIQIVKEPETINRYVTEKPDDEEEYGEHMEAMENMRTGLPPYAVLEIEKKFPPLLQDPWWLRYKALKIGFGELEGGVSGIDESQHHHISKVIDMAFCLHVRISDLMSKEKVKGSGPPSHREQVLQEFLDRAFPPGSPRRINLETLFSGGVRGLIYFENEVRELFANSMARVEQKMAALGVRDHVGEAKEVELWLNFYMENFHPQPNVVPRVIMKHLKVARDGIEMAYRPRQGWVCMTIQRKTLLEASAKTGRNLSYLPERVLLLEKCTFASSMAHCILNGYYGMVGKGTSNERRTVIELDDKKLDQGNNIHNEMAFITQEQANALYLSLTNTFPYQAYDYLEILNKERSITGVFIMINLWRFGQVSIITRDNLSTWYCDEFEVAEMFNHALELRSDMLKLLREPHLQKALTKFFKDKKIDVDEVNLVCWANPNSLAPDGSLRYHNQLKDMEEGTTLSQVIMKINGKPKVAKKKYGM